MKDEELIIEILGFEEFKKLEKSRQRYFTLLLETKVAVGQVLADCRVHKRCAVFVQRGAQRAMANGSVLTDKDDQKVLSENLASLFEWVDTTPLTDSQLQAKWKMLSE